MSSGAPTSVFSLALVLALSLSARAGLPSARRTGLTEDDKPVSVFAGVAAGHDSNVRRASEDEESDFVVQLLAGAAFTGGNERSRADLRAQYRYDAHAELSDLDFDETRLALSAFTGTDKFRLRIVGAYEMLVDPTDAVIVDLLERTRTAYGPVVDLEFGAVGLGLGYSAERLDYQDSAHDRLDFEEETWSAEVRWTRRQTRQIFARFEAGDLDYLRASGRDRDFGRQRACLGLRAESARESGFEVGVGTDAVERGGAADESQSELYTIVRGTAVFRGGRSIVDGVLSHGIEAAPEADFERATHLLVRYTHVASRRLAWTVSLAGENVDLYRPVSLSDPLTRVVLDGGLTLELGSPGRTHGRCYLTLGHESRAAEVPADEYHRFRVLVGLALVH